MRVDRVDLVSARFEAVADKYLTVVLRGPSEFMCQCPLCDGEASLQFNIDKGLWVCFKCGQGGSAKRLVKSIGGSYSDPAVSVQVLQSALDNLKMKAKIRPTQILEENYLLRFKGDSPDGYWSSRRFTAATREKWGLGYDPIYDRCTIAYRDVENKLLGVIQRRLDNDFPRYLYPKGFGRSESLFGSWESLHRRGNEATLVEGSTDCIFLDQCGYFSLAQYGSSISTRQVQLLRRLGLKKLILFYDYDEAGRKAETQAIQMLDGFILYRAVWDEKKYCWHKKLCGCGKHDWKNIAQCQQKLLCRCGRKHDADPGSLRSIEISAMHEEAQLVGRKEEKKTWRTNKFVKSPSAPRKLMGG